MSTTELTEKYISEHRSIKNCLKKGLVNYSALSRLVAKDLGIEKKTSKEAILVAARRYKDKIKDRSKEEDIVKLFKESNIEIKNNVVRYIIDKTVYPDSLVEIEKEIKKNRGLFFSIEGSKSIIIILQKQNKKLVDQKFKSNVIDKKENLSLITVTSPGIAKVPGAVNYISGLFFDNEVNIEEFMSCYNDTLIVVENKYTEKIMKCLNF